MELTTDDWHRRFTKQAQWTKDLRAYLYSQSKMEQARFVLEVGCGTGALLVDLQIPNASITSKPVHFGLDINNTYLNMAMRNAKHVILTQADAHNLPYQTDCFDITICHYLLLWVADPLRVLSEMSRVTRPGGALLALAEPDYGGRIDFPQELNLLGQAQTESLQAQGADPLVGRKLASLFQRAGLESVETGLLGGQWSGPPDWDQWESEWAILESDLKNKSSCSDQLDYLKNLDKCAYQRGDRILFVPTFYAWGKAASSTK